MQRRRSTAEKIWCGACRRMQPRGEFGRDKNAAEGLAYACKAVVAERNQRSHAKARTRINARQAVLRAARKRAPDAKLWVLKKLVGDAMGRAKRRGLEFGIAATDLAMPTHCPLLGITLVYQADRRRQDGSASLDRIDSKKGYVPGNCWIISWRANQLKSDGTPQELRRIAAALARFEHNGFPAGFGKGERAAA